MRNSRRFALKLTALALTASLLPVQAVLAHHGWGWASDEEFEITGTIRDVKLGNPHGLLTIDVQGAAWTIEVGQPWRNAQAGLKDDLLSVGRLITVHGHRSAKESERLVKAERVIIGGKSYNLYPDRES